MLQNFNNFLTISQQNETSAPMGTQLCFLFFCWCPSCLFDENLTIHCLHWQYNSQNGLIYSVNLLLSYSVTFSYSFTLHWASICTLHSLLPMNKVLTGLTLNSENKKNIFSRKSKCANIIEKSQLMILPILSVLTISKVVKWKLKYSSITLVTPWN